MPNRRGKARVIAIKFIWRFCGAL